jgi:hypothetical protein
VVASIHDLLNNIKRGDILSPPKYLNHVKSEKNCSFCVLEKKNPK